MGKRLSAPTPLDNARDACRKAALAYANKPSAAQYVATIAAMEALRDAVLRDQLGEDAPPAPVPVLKAVA